MQMPARVGRGDHHDAIVGRMAHSLRVVFAQGPHRLHQAHQPFRGDSGSHKQVRPPVHFPIQSRNHKTRRDHFTASRLGPEFQTLVLEV